MIQAAINGNRNDDFVPKTTEKIMNAALSAVEAGAESIHFHARNNVGDETLEPKWVGEQVSSLQRKLKNIPVGISTGSWIEPNLDKRLEQISCWNQLPDFVSVNFDEHGYAEVADIVMKKGIAIEVGLTTLVSASNFINSKIKAQYVRILIEPQEQVLEEALKTVNNIEEILKNAGNKLPVLLHGVDHTCWDLLKLAFQKKYMTRIGLEDTIQLPNGRLATENAELVLEAYKINNAITRNSRL